MKIMNGGVACQGLGAVMGGVVDNSCHFHEYSNLFASQKCVVKRAYNV